MSVADLNTYKLQMQQVNAALTADPDNQELLTLKTDLEQVIALTQDLIQAQLDPSGKSSDLFDSEPSSSSTTNPSSVSSSNPSSKKRQQDRNLMPVKHWQVGEQCQAIYAGDNQYYEGVIEEITTDGEVSVKFRNTGNTGVTSLGLLRISKLGLSGTTSSKNKREQLAKQKEYLKKKKAKKLERLKVMEEEREQEKNKWKNFSSKAFGKKGFVKKSIFKTPENAQGRVGVGTCGVSGQEMTSFSVASKYRKGN